MRRFHNSREKIQHRRALRSALTPVEAVLWRALQRSALHGRKFRRQQGIGPYIVDFYCPDEKLVVELEGSAHDSEQAASKDRTRELFLRTQGFNMIRIENRHVVENLEGALAYISQHFRIP